MYHRVIVAEFTPFTSFNLHKEPLELTVINLVNKAIRKNYPLTRKSSCVNARGIPTAAYQVLHTLSYPRGGRGIGTLG